MVHAAIYDEDWRVDAHLTLHLLLLAKTLADVALLLGGLPRCAGFFLLLSGFRVGGDGLRLLTGHWICLWLVFFLVTAEGLERVGIIGVELFLAWGRLGAILVGLAGVWGRGSRLWTLWRRVRFEVCSVVHEETLDFLINLQPDDARAGGRLVQVCREGSGPAACEGILAFLLEDRHAIPLPLFIVSLLLPFLFPLLPLLLSIGHNHLESLPDITEWYDCLCFVFQRFQTLQRRLLLQSFDFYPIPQLHLAPLYIQAAVHANPGPPHRAIPDHTASQHLRPALVDDEGRRLGGGLRHLLRLRVIHFY